MKLGLWLGGLTVTALVVLPIAGCFGSPFGASGGNGGSGATGSTSTTTTSGSTGGG